ncbi:MAG: hypothetical protein ACC661_08025, partial [Verrucomicrobiales bacterium]
TVSMALLALTGIFVWLRRGRAHAFLLAVLLLPAIAFYAYGYFRQKYLFPWYFVYLLPALLLFVAVGIGETAARIASFARPGDPGLRRALWGASILAVLLPFLAVTAPKRELLRTHSVDPLRESVLRTRPSLDPNDPSQPTRFTAHIHYPALLYDPYGFAIHDPGSGSEAQPGLARLMRWSDQFDIPLLLNIGYIENARLEKPEIMKLVDQPDIFTKVETVWAQEPQLVREIYRYRGGIFSVGRP